MRQISISSKNFLGIILGLLLLGTISLPAFAGDETGLPEHESCFVREYTNAEGHRMISVRILVNANQRLVWQTIRDSRQDDPDVQYSKITQVSDTEKILEQKYVALPVFGATTCVMKVNEDMGKRVDYKLIKSDRLAEFEGSWILTQAGENKTMMELSNHIKLKLPVPQKLVDMFTGKKLAARALFVKTKAESAQLSIASNAD